MKCWLLVCAVPMVFGAAPASAQPWPTRPVRVIVPFPAGGAADVMARLMAVKYSDTFGQQFVVDNRAGATGNIGGALLAKATADGQTIMFATTGPLALNRLMYKNTPYNPETDFAPVILFADVPMIIVAHPSVPVKSLKDLIALAKAQPGKLTYASPGMGSMGHLVAELVQRNTAISLTHVPYKGSAPAVVDLLGGLVNVSSDLVATYIQHVRAGKVRALAVSTSTRFDALPDVPTVAESGVPGFEAAGWFGIAGPVGMPTAVIGKLNHSANSYLVSAEGIARLRELGVRPLGGPPERLGRFVSSEIAKWRPIVEPLAAQLQ